MILYSTVHPPFEKLGCILSSKLWSVGTNPQERNNLVTGTKVRANRAGGVEPVSGNLMMVWPSRLIHRGASRFETMPMSVSSVLNSSF